MVGMVLYRSCINVCFENKQNRFCNVPPAVLPAERVKSVTMSCYTGVRPDEKVCYVDMSV